MILMMLLVFVGGAVGTFCRMWLSTWIARWADSRFPWGTLTVNVVGSFLIGVILEWPDVVRHAAGSRFWVALLAVGFCAGLTTFSSFRLQTLALLLERRWAAVVGNVALSTISCVLAVAGGAGIAKILSGVRIG
jgi:fluoride exporter